MGMSIVVKLSRGPRGDRPWKFRLAESLSNEPVGHFFYPADVELTEDVIVTEAWEHVLDPSIVESISLDTALRSLFYVEENESDVVPLLRRVILSGLLPLLETHPDIPVSELLNRANRIGAIILPCLNSNEFMATFKAKPEDGEPDDTPSA